MFYLPDIVSIQKPNGTLIENVKASVQQNKIFIFDVNLPIEEGDKICRKLRNGLTETYVVLDRGFINALSIGSVSHYEVQVEKESRINEHQDKSINVSTGDNARISINSIDNSINNNNADDIFVKIVQELQKIKDETVKNQAIKALDELKTEQNKPSFFSKYTKFLGIIADHLTLAAPWLQELTRLIP